MNRDKPYLGFFNPKLPIHIIGGGFTGLSLAYFLKKEDIDFQLFEKEDFLGGKLQTKIEDEGHFEQAANALYSSPLILEVLKDLDLEYMKAKPKLKKYILKKHNQISAPLKKRELFPIILKLFKKTPDQVKDSLSVEDFFTPLLGRDITQNVLASALTGIYAEHISNLHLRSVFNISPKKNERYLGYFLRLKKTRNTKEHKPFSLNFSGGITRLILALKEFNSENIHLSSQKDSISKNVNTIIATDAHEAAELLISQPEIAAKLREIEYSQLKLTHCFSTYKESKLEKAFGIVTHPRSKMKVILGILANSSIFPHQLKKEKLNSYSFITKDSEQFEKDLASDLKELGLAEILNKSLKTQTKNWKRAIPKYNYKRYQNIIAINNLLTKKESGLIITGNYICGISLREILQNSQRIAQDIKKEIQNV